MNSTLADGNNPKPELQRLTLGMLPLNDAAPLIVALEKGFFADEGLDVSLSVEASWAGLRDGMQLGMLDGAQMLALMPLASTLGLDGRAIPLISAMTLNLGGNAITVSQAVHAHMIALDPDAMRSPVAQAKALAQVIETRRETGESKLRFANVYAFSSHRYLLRYWLAAGGIDPENDLELRVVPPTLMASQLESGRLDGYCVGEPWNRLAASRGQGRMLCGSFDIWGGSQEKVFGVREAWAQQYPNTHRALLRALLRACRWLDEPGNREQAARLLCLGGYLDVSPAVVESGLRDPQQASSSREEGGLAGATLFHRHAANFPWHSQTLWYARQMQRWGHLDKNIDLQGVVERCVRPDLYRQAAADLGISVPLVDSKAEGAHDAAWRLAGDRGDIVMMADRFLDGRHYGP
ncbi:CmpA/NrtA family ABC transporter substrate-binding protein [Modicisalibacter xianhensis]|uniref:Nitrate/nitrite transport system substrate-binding protein n=1 Tax=Modicisalibacter xianhensis TaxID=442341 RepID=A0A1I2XVW1_9GAMM|nr:CmpA/NrtA family ABC transporter substrate-binding protein [Halomonas xianhensis]SFH17199.1 nitrate/nitrite transport system substrate-binding protein [Halomonas xianhensis]